LIIGFILGFSFSNAARGNFKEILDYKARVVLAFKNFLPFFGNKNSRGKLSL
jgi:hypothetical protein